MLSIDSNAEPGTLVVTLPGVGTYELHHGWKSGTDTWIDGKIVFPGGQRTLQLDIACSSDEFLTDPDTQKSVTELWGNGSVYSIPPGNGGVRTLVVPGTTLCDENVLEALSRFRP